jgi:hypothetical protein
MAQSPVMVVPGFVLLAKGTKKSGRGIYRSPCESHHYKQLNPS